MQSERPDPRWFAKPIYKLVKGQIVVRSKLPSFDKDGAVELYRYQYFPFLTEDLKTKLTAQFDNSQILEELFECIEATYQRQQFDLMHRYFERSIGIDDKKELIESELALQPAKSILSQFVYREIYQLMVYQKIYNTTKLSDLIYADLNSTPFVINLKPAVRYAPILDSISQSVRKRYINFLKGELRKGDKTNLKEKKKTFFLRDIAIAYYLIGITIDANNALEITGRHSKYKSDKILQKRVAKTNQLTDLSGNKAADTKHLKSLKRAKQLMSGIKKYQANPKQIKDIDPIITAFQDAFDAKY